MSGTFLDSLIVIIRLSFRWPKWKLKSNKIHSSFLKENEDCRSYFFIIILWYVWIVNYLLLWLIMIIIGVWFGEIKINVV